MIYEDLTQDKNAVYDCAIFYEKGSLDDIRKKLNHHKDMLKWIEENCMDSVYVDYKFFFTNKEDAMRFKLVWC